MTREQPRLSGNPAMWKHVRDLRMRAEEAEERLENARMERDKFYAVVRIYAMLPGYGDAAREILEELGLE